MIWWREELKETPPQETRELDSVYTSMHRVSHFALLFATLVCFVCLFVFFVIALGFIYIFNTIVHLNVCFGNIQVCYKDALFSL